MARKSRALLLVGSAVHLASLLLPFASFDCYEPPPLFSLDCAIFGGEYFLLALIAPSLFSVALFAAACLWLASLLFVVAHAASGRLRRIGRLASLLLAPSFFVFVAAMPPHSRWLGQACAGIGAALVLWGAILSPSAAGRGAPA